MNMKPKTIVCVCVCRARQAAAEVRHARDRDALNGGMAVFCLYLLTNHMNDWKPGFFSCMGPPVAVQRRRKAQK